MYRITRALSASSRRWSERKGYAPQACFIFSTSEAACAVGASTDGFRAVEWVPLESLVIRPSTVVHVLDRCTT